MSSPFSSNSTRLAYPLNASYLTSDRYRGFQGAQVVWSPQPNPDGTRVKMAQVIFESSELATTAKEALNGFTLKKGWLMNVVYM